MDDLHTRLAYSSLEKRGVFWLIYILTICYSKENMKACFPFWFRITNYFGISDLEMSEGMSLDLTYALSFLRDMSNEKKIEVGRLVLDFSSNFELPPLEQKTLSFLMEESGIKSAMTK